ncbi:MAG: cysteine desulfurase [Pedosphaera sp.]|nr:cysteine desulfurase [Pedosphaera sp.]
MRHVFLDHQTTTPVLPAVLEAMTPYFTEHFGAPASLHRHGLRARDALGKARSQIAALINAESPEDIIFTSGATESANLAVKGTAYARQRKGNHIVVSATEHLSVLNSIEFLEKQGFTCTKIKVDAAGFVDPEQVRAALTEQTILVCVHHVNHELGTIEPIREIGALAGERGIPFFVDAVASGGWLPVDVQAMGAGLLSLSPHRFYGPKGVGVLYRNRRARLNGIQQGGSQEEGRRAGTENVPAIVGAGVAAEIALREMPRRIAHTANLQRKLWESLKARIPYIKLNGPEPGPQRISTNLNVSVEFVEGEGMLLLLDMQGIAAASGPSCISKALKVSHVLEATGLDHALAQGNLVISLGKENTSEEMEYVAETFEKVVKKLRGLSPLWDEFQHGTIDSVLQPREEAAGATKSVH